MSIPHSLILVSAFSALLTPAQDAGVRYYDAIRNDNRTALRDLLRSDETTLASVKDKAGTTPLMYAAAVGSLDTMKALIDAGADVNAKNEFGVTALMWCATDEAKVRLLLAKGANVNARSKQGRTPILIAAGTEGTRSIVELLLSKGADLKNADADPISTPLTAAADANDTATLRLLLDRGASANGPAGAFALTSAAGHGNLEMMRLLLAKGVSPDVPSPPVSLSVKHGDIALGLLRPLHLAAATGGIDAVRLLIDQKVDVNAQDVRGMTPLMFAIAVDQPDARVVRLLLERGADPSIHSKSGETAAQWAAKYNHPQVLGALKVTAERVTARLNERPLAVPEALQKSADLLHRTSASFFVESGCPACHAQNVASMALLTARKAGVRTSADSADSDRVLQTKTFWFARQQGLLQRVDAPGGHNMLSYSVLQFAADAAPADMATDAMVHNIAAQQQLNGSWHNDGIMRPPLGGSDFTHTAIAIRSLSLYGPAGRKAEFASRIARASSWLRQAKPVTAEDYNMQLLGLVWSGADRVVLDQVASTILAAQRAEGGWSQTPTLGSDAYATGQTLTALKESGFSASDPAYRKGIDYLLRTQLADGSWHVASRAAKIQPYFQSGFPHDHDQWISMAGTAWATMALAYAMPEPKAVALN